MNVATTGDSFGIVAYPFLAVFLLARLIAGPADKARWQGGMRALKTAPAMAILLFANGERTQTTLWGLLLQCGNFLLLILGIILRLLGHKLPLLPFAIAYAGLILVCLSGWTIESIRANRER